LRFALLGIVLAAIMATSAPAQAELRAPSLVEADCAPPCGPISVVLSLKVEKTRELVVPEDGPLTLPGKITYYFDADQEGYAYDDDNKPVATFKVPRGVSWLRATFEPSEIAIPVDDPKYIQQEDPQNDPSQLMFYYEHPVKVTIERTRMPTATELKEQVRNDGQYRMLLATSSEASMVEQGGYQVGLMEGYGVRELRFLPEDVPMPNATEDGGNAPGPAFALIIAALGIALVIARRR
jgi:hypothetical protein